MSVLFYWKGENYIPDMTVGKSYHLNQSSELIIKLKTGDHIWAFTRINGIYILAVDLLVQNTQHNPPGYKYGTYRALGDRQRTRYFDVYQGLDVEPEIRKIFPQAPSSTKSGKRVGLGSFFQGLNGVRVIDSTDEQHLIDFSRSLPTI